MPIFQYKALTEEKKRITGLVEAASEGLAVDILKEKELEILSIEKASEFERKQFFFLGRTKMKDIVIFSRQFAVLVSASVSLVHSLKLLVDQTSNLKLKKIVSEVASEVDAGAKLSDTLAKYPKVFSDFYVNVVRSGETSGKLDEVLNYLADELEKDYDMTSKIKGAMIYPAFVLFGLGIVGVVMMVFVVPKLTDVLEETGGELPLPTKILIATSDFMASYWIFLIVLLAGLVIGFRAIMRLPAAKQVADMTLLKLPIFGRLFHRIYLVRFTRSMQTLIVGGVTISRGLEIAAQVVSNSVYKSLIEETKKEVEDGNSIATVFAASSAVPVMVPQMLSIGEKTGKLEMVLSRITDFYTREINNIVANLMTLMEPIIMVIIGVAVGVMVAAIILPMYNMATNM